MANVKDKLVIDELRNLGIPFGWYGAKVVNKYTLYELGCTVKEYFNSSEFKSKSSGRVQHIDRVELLEHGTVVYFWCFSMNNFIVAGNTKKDTYNKLISLLADILWHKDETYFNVFRSLRGE